MDITSLVAKFCVETNYNDFSTQLIAKAKDSIVDTYGVIYSGYNEESSNIIVNWIKNQHGKANSTIFGYDYKSNANLAALANGIMAHALDYDDIESVSRSHPSAVILPALLAVAEEGDSNGKELLTAYVIGVEVMCKLGGVINPSHHYKGWHPTSTLGTIGSAIAVGKLYNFNTTEMKRVIGLASSMASGIRKNFGTMTKHYHVGMAAQNGVIAAQLVKKGFTSSENVLDDNNSFINVFSEEEAYKNLPNHLGNEWILVSPGVNLKKYPCCYAGHRIADAALNLVTTHEIDTEKIEQIECRVPKRGLSPLAFDNPKDGFEAKFSLQFIVSAMLVNRELTNDTFSDQGFNHPKIQNLLSKVTQLEDPEIKQDRAKGDIGYVKLIIRTGNETYEKKVYFAKGTPENPLTVDEMKQKFISCTEEIMGQIKATDIFNQLYKIEEIKNVKSIIM